MADVTLLHVYEHYAHHDDVWIVGNVDGLLALRNAVDAALHHVDGVGHADVMVSDGEGFAVNVVCDDSDWQGDTWQRLLLPYTADYARSNEGLTPRQVAEAQALRRGVE